MAAGLSAGAEMPKRESFPAERASPCMGAPAGDGSSRCRSAGVRSQAMLRATAQNAGSQMIRRIGSLRGESGSYLENSLTGSGVLLLIPLRKADDHRNVA